MSVSYWLDPLRTEFGTLRGKAECDVVVIGGGLCGTSAAYHLAEEGISVALVEARTLSASASGRNAGFLLQGTAERYSRAVSLMGREKAKRVHGWSLENHRLIAEVIQKEGIDCGYQKRGSLQLAGSPEEEKELRESADLLNEDGFKAAFVDHSDLAPALQRAGFAMGVHLPEDGELQPASFVRAIGRAAANRGVRVFENSRVIAMDASVPGAVEIQCEEGRIQASLAIVATNARAGDLLPSLADKIDPIRGQMLSTGPEQPLFDCPIYANHGYDYWRQDEAGCVVLGGWRNLDPDGEVGHDESVQEHIQNSMAEFLQRMGVNAPILHQWAGIMGFSRDGLPMVGPAPGSPGALAGVGFTGHGFGFAFLAGKALAIQALEGQHPFCVDFDPRRFL
jgi:glycine/D-amino acid oxidase-like deaminating enzyme